MDDRYIGFHIIGEELPRYIKIKEEKSVIPNGQFKVRPTVEGFRDAVYTVLKDAEGSYLVSWDNQGAGGGAPYYSRLTYPESTVEVLLRNGWWEIVEEPPAQEVQTGSQESRDSDVLVAEQADDDAGSVSIRDWPVINENLLKAGTINTSTAEPYISLKEVQEFAEETNSVVIIDTFGDFRVKCDYGDLYAADRNELMALMQSVYAVAKASKR